jgi:hypothetical protein
MLPCRGPRSGWRWKREASVCPAGRATTRRAWTVRSRDATAPRASIRVAMAAGSVGVSCREDGAGAAQFLPVADARMPDQAAAPPCVVDEPGTFSEGSRSQEDGSGA